VEWDGRRRAIPLYSRAWLAERVIRCPPIRSRWGYLVALHELGHVVRPGTECSRRDELEAWHWALAVTHVLPSEALEGKIAGALRSHGVPDEAIAGVLRGADVDVKPRARDAPELSGELLDAVARECDRLGYCDRGCPRRELEHAPELSDELLDATAWEHGDLPY
jgi:hypothetical protein